MSPTRRKIEPHRCIICHAEYRKVKNAQTCGKACSDEHKKARILRFDAVYHRRYYRENRERILANKKAIYDADRAHPLPPPMKAPHKPGV